MKKKCNVWIWLLILIVISDSCKKDEVPIVTTNVINDISETTAISGGNVTDGGSSLVLAKGVCWSTNLSPTIIDNKTWDGSNIGSFVSNIYGLTANTKYFLKAYATNSSGTGYGSEKSFTTSQEGFPGLTTTSISSISQTTAVSGGTFTSEDYQSVISRGVCWSLSSNPTIEDSHTNDGSGAGTFTSSITGLIPDTYYYVRAYTLFEGSTIYCYGNEIRFNTIKESITVTDIDGNVYGTTTVGNKLWMAENLKTTRYADGTPLTLWLDTYYPSSLKAYCWYDGNINNKDVYGALYTWSAAMNGESPSNSKPSGIQGVCPTGWHLPSDAEWTQLIISLGGEFSAGGKLKEAGTSHWESPNTGATNESGFTALPGGTRSGRNFSGMGKYGYWWSTTFLVEDFITHSLKNDSNSARSEQTMGDPYLCLSVRCLKDY
jgi:uncharacterized protein (TIGR02145 family)